MVCEILAGKLSVKDWQIDAKGGAFEPIVSDETFRVVQAILSGRRATTIRRRRNNPAFPLTQFVKCGSCQRPLTGSYSTSQSRQQRKTIDVPIVFGEGNRGLQKNLNRLAH